ncbi:Ionotropic receptor 212, partial [Hyalella azteca]
KRAAAVDLSHPYFLESSTVLSRAPAPASRALAVFSPFTSTVWAIILLCLLLAGPVSSFISYAQKRLHLRTEKNPLTVKENAFNAFKVLFMQAVSPIPETAPLRLFAFFWYIFSLNFVVLYSGNLTAVFAAPPLESSIDTLGDLLVAARRDGVLPVTLKGSSLHALFEVYTAIITCYIK